MLRLADHAAFLPANPPRFGGRLGRKSRNGHTPLKDASGNGAASQDKPKASGWDWFVRIGVGLTMVFSGVTAGSAVIMQRQVSSVAERVPSQTEIDRMMDKVNDRLDALPSGDKIREYTAEIEAIREDLNELRTNAQEAGLLDDGTGNSKRLVQQLQLLSERLDLLEQLLGLGS